MKKVLIVEGKHDKLFFESLFKKLSINVEVKKAGNNAKIPRLIESRYFKREFNKIFVFIDSDDSTGKRITEKIKNKISDFFIAEKDLEGFISKDKECLSETLNLRLKKECVCKRELYENLGRVLVDEEYKKLGENFNPNIDKNFLSFLEKLRDP